MRREFALLERSLAALGETRHPSQTARQYLLRAGARHAAPPSGHTAMAVLPGNDDTRERLIRGYEAARYSQHALSWQDAADFRSLARLVPRTGPSGLRQEDALRSAGEGHV